MKHFSLLPLSVLISGCFLASCGSSTDDSSTSNNDSSSALMINEIVASAENDGNDWIELYAKEAITDLSSYSIVDDSSSRTPQTLPAVSLEQGDYIVIQAIDEADTPPEDAYYVTFKLGGDDAVILYNNNSQVDELDWEEGDAPQGASYGYPVNSTTAQMLSPTPGAANDTLDTEIVALDAIVNNDAELRINEIVAKDTNGGNDWIELYVTGTTSVYLGDYSIADDNYQLVSLPSITLASGEYYRVYATTDEVEGSETVAFKLGSSDQVSLFKGDDLIDQLTWDQGQALIGFSYGRFPDGSDNTQVLTPTALSSNQLATHGPLVINEVVAKDSDGGNDWFELYNNSDTSISLANYQVIDESDDIDPVSLPDVVLQPNEYIVIYATDEDPNDYYVPFKLGSNDELSLILNDETVDFIEWDESYAPAGYSYGLSDVTSDTDSWNKTTLSISKGSENSIATAFEPDEVRNLYIDISTENWSDILANPLDEEYHEAAITFNGVTLDSIAFRTKGGSSLSSVANSSSDRYSFKIDINEYVSGQRFFGLKKFTLQNSFNDPSYMREAIAYDLLDEMGVATPKHAYVNVYINNELFGFYLMVEAIDSEFLANHFDNANGDLYKPDGTGSDLLWIDSDITSYSDINLKTNEDTTDNGAFINFVDQLDNGSTDVIDVDNLLKYMAVSVSLSNLDSYFGALAHNYYLYEQDGVFVLLPWDFNESFGTFNMDCNREDIRELYIDEPTSGALADRPLIANVFANADHLATYHDYLWQLIEGPLASDAFDTRVTNMANLIREHVANDPSAFYGSTAFETNLDSTYSRFYGLTGFMSYRVNNMTQQLEGDLPSKGTGSGFCR